jgi:ABC-type lipoprotein export system ATPase subunit
VVNDTRGSLWRRWDLHVHTPESLYHNYGCSEDVWERFITALEQLPKDFSVIGINDYLFLEGYRKVLEFKSQGRLRNIDTFLPVLEFRLARFAGTEGKLRRINYHVVFSNEIISDLIEQQFLNQLKANYKLSPGVEYQWGGIITHESMTDLGRAIIASVPDEKKADYGSPMLEGFNNLNLPLEAIEKALASPYFDNNYITAVGKTEWTSLKWNDQSIAEKKTLINGANAVFTSADNANAYEKARETLQVQGVNDHLLDCSDAHNWADSGDKDSLGRCELWLKADPTFRGLQHALLEFEERVYVGSEPPKMTDVKRGPQRYIRSLEIRKKVPGTSLAEQWFDSKIEFNPGLVAIIGNKGSGKSALADIVALGGNSQQEENFSFLNDDKFKNPREDKSVHFEATLSWQSGDSATYGLSCSPDAEDVERVRYIPQSYLETLCNELASEGGGAFDLELRAVIFSHLPNAERLGKQSLDSLLDYLGEEALDRINALKGELSKTNREIASLEDNVSPEHKREVEKRHTARLKELSILKGNEPRAVPKPDADPATKKAVEEHQARIEALRKSVVELDATVEAARQERKLLLAKIATAEKVLQRIRNLEKSGRLIARESEEDLEALGLKWEDLVKLEVDTATLKTLHARLTTQEATAKEQLATENEKSSVSLLATAKDAITQLQNQLDAPTRRHQEYLTAHKEWADAVGRLESDSEDADCVANLRMQLKRISEIPRQIAVLEGERLATCKAIYEQLTELEDRYRKLYHPVRDFIQKHKTLADSIKLSFDVRISEVDLVDNLSAWINKGRSGTFQGAEDGVARIKEIVKRNAFDTPEGLEAFLNEFMQALQNDLRQEKQRPMSTVSQLKNKGAVDAFYDFLFGLDYLKPRYALKMEDKEIFELSPGERGLLLLLFYLLVEKSDGPLIIDQPEENLDNETVHNILVPAIQLAKRRRQIIIVTHNPNLAVVADADQIIAASIDKQDFCRVSYVSGALENPELNKHVVRYLEGTLPAFMNRDHKYIR